MLHLAGYADLVQNTQYYSTCSGTKKRTLSVRPGTESTPSGTSTRQRLQRTSLRRWAEATF